ncbi:MAG: TIM-barrel domain-containing protein, partial [Clostridiales bacterium]
MKKILILNFTMLLLCSISYSQSYPGNFTSFLITDTTVTIKADSSSLTFSFLSPEIIKVQYSPFLNAQFDSSFSVIQKENKRLLFSVKDLDSTLEINTTDATIICQKYPIRISYFDPQKRSLLSEPKSGGLSALNYQRWVGFELSPDEHLYGTGERGIALDKRGQAFASENTQNYGYQNNSQVMSINVPLLLSTKGYALFIDNSYLGRWDLGWADPGRFYYYATGGEITYYLIVAKSIKKQIEKYTWLTGRQPLQPRWSLGFIQSKYGYKNETEARDMVTTMRQKNIPCDALVLDLYWFNKMGDISWDMSRWSDPFKMMDDFLSTGIKTIVITEPYLTQASGNYYEALNGGYLAKDANGQILSINNWWSCNCTAGLLDITNPNAQKWWWKKHPSFFGNQLSGIWTDLGEPEAHPSEAVFTLGPMKKVQNIYNLLWAKTIFEGYREFRPGKRLFNLTRAGFAGMQRYSAITWSGDVLQSFSALDSQLPNLLNTGLSGMGYHHSDAGGFVTLDNSSELYTRWLQFAAFTPIMRAHGNSSREPWIFGSPTEELTKEMIQLRYRLLPYIYTTAFENYRTGAPIIRPLVFEYQDDPNVSNLSDPYLFGQSMLVSPVTQPGATEKSVYFPKGEWIEYWTDRVYNGNKTNKVAAPLDRIPLFVRSGSIIPMQPVMNYSNEKELDTLILSIYPSLKESSEFTLYEDDGTSLEYQTENYSNTLITQALADGSSGKNMLIDIIPDGKNYKGKPLNRVYRSEVHLIELKPSFVKTNSNILSEKKTLDELKKSESGFYFDDTSSKLFVQSSGDINSTYHIEIDNVEILSGVKKVS